MDWNNTARNRQIKADRVYKTLGKMSLPRVLGGVLLLVFVFILAGCGAEFFLERENYSAAQKMIVSDSWMEKNKPEVMTLISAGAALTDGDAGAAFELVSGLGIADIPAKFLDEYADICGSIADHYAAQTGDEAQSRAEKMLTARDNALSTVEQNAKSKK